MPGVEEQVMASRMQSSGCTISTTVATLILWQFLHSFLTIKFQIQERAATVA